MTWTMWVMVDVYRMGHMVPECEEGVSIDPPAQTDLVAAIYMDMPGPEPGVYDMDFPIDHSPCLAFGSVYALSVVAGDSIGVRDTFTDCSNWFDIGHGMGWFPMETSPDPPFTQGDLLIYAEAECCEGPVTAVSRSWGSIKALFRD